MSQKKLTILFEGWYDIPHSYSIILAFKIIYLYKKYKNVTFYKKKCEYYNPNWTVCKVLPIDYQKILDDIPEYNPLIHVPDIIYSVLFPYDVSVPSIKKCVFYTSEFRTLNPSYFKNTCDKSFTDLYFTGPSKWSIAGLKDTVPNSRNRLISHGADPDIFYKSTEDRIKFRSKYGIKDEIVFLNMGSMTSNKNVSSVILAFLQIIIDCILAGKEPKYRLILKGSDQLYGSSTIVKGILSQIASGGVDVSSLVEKYIIFIYDMLTYDEIRCVYNGSDAYVGPYLAEGFSLNHLESLFCSLPIIVPSTGATEDYINDLQNDPNTARLIHTVPSVVKHENNQYYNSIDINDIMTAMKSITINNAEHDRTYLLSKYSWSVIVDQLYDYFVEIAV